MSRSILFAALVTVAALSQAVRPALGQSNSTKVGNSKDAALPASLREAPESKSIAEMAALPGTGTVLDLSEDPSDKPFAPDPAPAAASIPAGTASISDVDPYDKVSAPVVLNSSDGVFLISIGRNKAGSPQETRGRIYTVDLANNEAKLAWDHPQAVRVLDHDAASGRTLIVDKLDHFQRGGELVMLHGLATGNASPLYSRSLPGAGKPGFAPQVEWAKLLSSSHAAAIVNRALHVWDLASSKLIYRIDNVTASEPPAFSGSGRYMAVPQSGKVVIVDTATGEIRKSIETGSLLKPGVAFHPDGRRLATCFSNQYIVWDCVAEAAVSEATTTDQLGSHPVSWISPEMFLSRLGDAVHTELGMSVWKYSVSGATQPEILGDKLLTATTSRNCTLVSVEIPHAPAEESITKLMKAGDAAMLVRPGSSVAISVETTVEGVDKAEIKSALAKAAEKAGWKVSNEGAITLVAKIGRGETKDLRFRNLRGGNKPPSTAKLTPFTAQLEIRRDTDALWTRSTENRIPSLLRLQEGETVQDAVKRYEKPDSNFFSLLNLPPRIPKPEVSAQVGRSILRDGKWQDLSASRLPRRPRRPR